MENKRIGIVTLYKQMLMANYTKCYGTLNNIQYILLILFSTIYTLQCQDEYIVSKLRSWSVRFFIRTLSTEWFVFRPISLRFRCQGNTCIARSADSHVTHCYRGQCQLTESPLIDCVLIIFKLVYSQQTFS